MKIEVELRRLEAIQATLDKITIKGRADLDRMLGVMQTVDDIIDDLKNHETEVNEHGNSNS